MTYKCKICGGQTTIDAQSGIAICEYCGTKQALPLFTADSERLLYDRGNNYLLHSEYDKAENVFSQLLTIKPGAAELYWDLVLCKYGVTYVKDPKTDKYIPTCNRTHYIPIFSDENYKKAIEMSSGEKKALFEEDAKTIDNIQKGIIAVSKKEKPFDIFISYKETDENGNRTKDSVKAQKLYEKLTEAGYKVFFSRVTLEDKIGAEYEPYIYAALYSSKVMLTICSSKENIEAVWVKNEWSRFLGFRQNDSTKTLLPLYFDMNRADLPEEFALLSAYDMAADGFTDELLRGIKKLIPLSIIKAERRKQVAKTIGVAAACLAVAAGIAAAIIIPKELEQRRLEEEARRLQAEAEAKAREEAALAAAIEEAYQTACALFENKEYAAAELAFMELGDYKDSAHMAARCPVQPDYDVAMQYYYDGEYAQAAWAFEALGDYEDAAEQKEKAVLSWRKSLATIVAETGYSYYLNTYCVTPNGAVDALDGGSAHKAIKINEHGKVLSVSGAANESIYALYEDGTINGKNIGDVIQVTPSFMFLDNLVLKADGKVFIDGSGGEAYSAYRAALKWENIVMLAHHEVSSQFAGYVSALAGVDKDGNVFLCAYDGGARRYRTFMEYSGKFKNVKTIDIGAPDFYGVDGEYINAAALTKDGKLVSYINGKFAEQEASNIVDVRICDDTIYMLGADAKLYSNRSKDPILKDVVALCGDHFAITRSGMLYDLGGTKLNYTSCVYDEWLTRME